jgi:predicted ferric reductase
MKAFMHFLCAAFTLTASFTVAVETGSLGRKHVRYEVVVPGNAKVQFDHGIKHVARRQIGRKLQGREGEQPEPDTEAPLDDEATEVPAEGLDGPEATEDPSLEDPSLEEPSSNAESGEEADEEIDGEQNAFPKPKPANQTTSAGSADQTKDAIRQWQTYQVQHPEIGWTVFPFVMGGLVLAFWICQGRRRSKEEVDAAKAKLRVEGHLDARHAVVERRATEDAIHQVEKVTPLGTATESDLAVYAGGCEQRVGALLKDSYTAKDATDLVAKASACYKLKLSQQAIAEAAGGILTLSNAMQSLKAKKKEHLDKFQSAVHKVSLVRNSLQEISHSEPEHHEENDLFTLIHFTDVEKDRYDEKDHGKPVLEEKGRLESLERSETFANWAAFLTVYIPLRIIALIYLWYIWTFRNPVVMFAGYWFLISRMEGLLLALLTMCILLLMTRGLLKRIRNLLSPGSALSVVIDKHVLVHRMLAVSLVFSAFWHTVAHNLALLRMLNVNPKDALKLKGPLGMNPSSYREGGAFASWPNVSGWILWAILIGFCSLSLKRVRRPMFEVFHYPHLVFTWLWVTFLISHGSQGWTGIGIPVCLILVFPVALWYGIERGFQIRSSTHPSIFLESAFVYGKTMVLQINLRGSDYTYTTGEYSMVRVPEISEFQWHPFTIASSSEHQLRLVIAQAGNFTKDLAARIQAAQKKAGPNGEPMYPEINVRGGFGAPATGMHFSQHFIMVGAGVGATPFLSFFSSICNEWILGKKSAAARVDYSHVLKARFYWVSREAEDFIWVNHYQEILRTHPDLAERVSLHLILSKTLETTTQEGVSAAELALFWHGLRVAMASGAHELAASVGVPTQFGRPNWDKEFVDMASQIERTDNKAYKPTSNDNHMHMATHRQIGVYICGNDKLVHSLEQAAVKVSNNDIEFKLFAEEF